MSRRFDAGLVRWLAPCCAALVALSVPAGAADDSGRADAPAAAAASLSGHSAEDLRIALDLAAMLRAARTVISDKQALINDDAKGDKGLTGDVVVADAIANYKAATGKDPMAIDKTSLEGKLIAAQLAAVRAVVNENQDLINMKGVGFKGFVPAVFGRLVNEHFNDAVGQDALMKVTAPPNLVRNLKALPDDWEKRQIADHLDKADWPRGRPVTAHVQADGRDAFRFLVPEYYTGGCLACHGTPKGELDVTGYPKEGGKLGELGGAISITLFD